MNQTAFCPAIGLKDFDWKTTLTVLYRRCQTCVRALIKLTDNSVHAVFLPILYRIIAKRWDLERGISLVAVGMDAL